MQAAGEELPAGTITLKANKQTYNAGEEVLITVSGKGMNSINALQLILPYAEADMQFVSIEPKAVADMKNMTNDRLHRDGSKILYPTFVNVGQKNLISGEGELFVIRMKANRRFTLKSLPAKGMLVSPSLGILES